MTTQPTLDRVGGQAVRAVVQASSDVYRDVAWGQVQGRRKSQQDCAVCVSMGVEKHLLVLADGMGGHAAGDVASALAVRGFCAAYEAPGMPVEPDERLEAALEAANYTIHDRAMAEPALADMGTTLVAVVVKGHELRWVSVGDSPLWLVRGGGITRLNANHSVAGDLAERVAAGEMTAAEAAAAPGRSMLYSALMGGIIELVDIPGAPERLEPGDVIILASDGVETCGLDELASIVGDGDDGAAELVDRILDAVENHQLEHQDNATLIVCRLPLSEDQAETEEIPMSESRLAVEEFPTPENRAASENAPTFENQATSEITPNE